MKIGVHYREGSFSDCWIDYCKKHNIDYKVVNAFDSDIVQQVKDCDIFMWHYHHAAFTDILTAKRILFALEHAGIKVFPDFNTGWHFDDKVAQKYLLEAIDAPLVPSYVFYEKQRAIDWANATIYPKVFKLKGGAGASNVSLVKNERETLKIINKAFGKGFSQFNRWGYLNEQYQRFISGKDNIFGLFKGLGRLIVPPEFSRMQSREKGYVYFQEFIPNNSYDIRLIVIGGKYAYGLRRINRPNDFKASGSSNFKYDKIPLNVVEVAFKTSRKLKLQSCAFDFIFDEDNKPLIIEMSYGFGTKGSSNAPGYWDSQLNWHEGKFYPQEWMVEDAMSISNKR